MRKRTQSSAQEIAHAAAACRIIWFLELGHRLGPARKLDLEAEFARAQVASVIFGNREQQLLPDRSVSRTSSGWAGGYNCPYAVRRGD